MIHFKVIKIKCFLKKYHKATKYLYRIYISLLLYTFINVLKKYGQFFKLQKEMMYLVFNL